MYNSHHGFVKNQGRFHVFRDFTNVPFLSLVRFGLVLTFAAPVITRTKSPLEHASVCAHLLDFGSGFKDDVRVFPLLQKSPNKMKK